MPADLEQLRTDFDQLRQALHSDPTALGAAPFRGIPQVVFRKFSGAAFSGMDNDWVRVATFPGRGGMLYPDRVLDLTFFLTTSMAAGDYRPYSVRYTVNGETVQALEYEFPSPERLTQEFRLRIFALGSNYSQRIGTGEYQLDLASAWELGLDFRWHDNDIESVVVYENALGILW